MEELEDGTTLPLNYTLAPNDIRVPREQLEKEFLDLAEAQGVSDIEELNKILESRGRPMPYVHFGSCTCMPCVRNSYRSISSAAYPCS